MRTTILLTAALVLCAATCLGDVGKTWTTESAKRFSAGKLDGVSVLSTGEVELAPEVEEIEGMEAEFVWDLADDGQGTVYVATGGPAAVHAIRDGGLELLHKSSEKQVLSVLPMPDGAVLAGTAPEGVIYRIDRQGKVTTFADLEDSYVWDMVLTAQNRIYCATGPNGRLVELSRAGEVAERLKVKQKNLMCVAADADGTVYVGTDTDGYIYRVERGGKATVLYDAEEEEVHDLLVDAEGVVYACTAQGRSPGGGGPPVPRPSRSEGGEPSAPPSRPAGSFNSLYRIVPGEGATLMARFDKMFLLSLAPAGDLILAGSSQKGRLMAVGRDHTQRIVTEFDAEHLTAMVSVGEGEVIVGTSNAGSLWRLKPGPRKEGRLVADPFDAGYLSHWGRVRWKERAAVGQGIRLKVRTGNSGEPDEHWSEWSDWLNDSRGGDLGAPMGRFAQFEAELSTRGNVGSPTLLSVDVSYRQANRRPHIEDLAVDGESLIGRQEGNGPSSRGRPSPPGASNSRPSGRPGSPPAEKTIAWKAADPNGDDLDFHLYYRAMDEAEWKEIDEELEGKTSYTWDTSRVPDGHYLLRLMATDELARPAAEALTDEELSTPLLIDNSPPAVAEPSARQLPDGSYELTGVAVDAAGPIAAIQVSANADDWKPVFPTDGIMDSSREEFTFHTEVLEPGEYVFVFAVTDRSGNRGSGKVVVTVPAAGQ